MSLIPANLDVQTESASSEAIKSKLNEVNALSNYLQSTLAQRDGGDQSLGPLLQTIQTNLNKERDNLKQMIEREEALLKAQDRDIQLKKGEILTKERQLEEHRNNVAQQRKLMLLRDRMLQLSQERNVWKQKIIYVLLSLIIAVFVIIVLGYAYFGGRK